MSNFVHLHVHTHYSLLDGACRVKDLCNKALQYNMPAIAMTDHGNMFGTIDFYTTAKKMGVKPIIGVETYVAEGSRLERKRSAAHLVLFAKNNIGYKNLVKLTSAGYLDGFYYQPRIDKELLAQHSEGLICSSACLKGEVAACLKDGNYSAALRAADEYRQIFGKDNYYLEIMDHGIDEQKRVNEGIIKLSKELNIPIIATNDVHYLERNQARAHEALMCIQTQTTLNDPKRMCLSTDEFYFKSPEEMSRVFAEIPEALTNTLKIAEQCDVTIEFGEYHLPVFDPPEKKTQKVYLRELCEQGLRERFSEITQEIQERFDYELGVIDRMGFIAYFLIVWDFINYAKSHGIPVGPGRGSAAGSLVSYVLGITDLDPLKYGLIFERFLNPDRSGMPDIDIDFCFERRQEVIDYVNQKYTSDNVAQIITFGSMKAKAVIRDVGRALGIPYSDVDLIAKLIPNELGITLETALEKEPKLKDFCETNQDAKDILEIAKVLEGLNRHAGIHAAGVVISDKPLTEYVPLYKTSDNQITTAFEKGGVEKIGLLKMDFLGLKTLTLLNEAVMHIKNRHGIEIDISKICLEDQKTFDLLTAGNSFGVFQLESAGMRDLLKKARPDQFEDLIAILALYRPGPMGSGMLDDFILRKRGEVGFQYEHPKMESVLKNTYGIMVYQEQVMQLPVTLAGFSMAQADHLRRAMSKKIQSVMDDMRKDFVAGCKEHSGLAEDRSNYLFDLIDKFSGYGFNRSHSAAYAMISYQTAYLKANYPVEFMCALLNNELNNTDKIVEYVRECEAMGIKVLPPDVNESMKKFHVVDDKIIRFGLHAVKNVGGTAIDSIIEQRGSGYTSLYDLCERVDLRLVNKKVLESLIKCGALASFKAFRSQLMAVLERSLELASKKQKEKTSGQFSFFDMDQDIGGFNNNAEELPQIREWPQTQILSFEKDMLGFYVSGHPLSHYQVEIKEFTDCTTANLKEKREGQDVCLVALIEAVKLTNTRKTGERMAILRVEDIDGGVEVVVFPSTYAQVAEYIREGNVVLIRGKVSLRDDDAKIIVEDMKHVQDVFNSIKNMRIDLTQSEASVLEDLKNKFRKFPGRIPIYLNMNTTGHRGIEIMVGKDYFVTPTEELMTEIKELVGNKNFTVSF